MPRVRLGLTKLATAKSPETCVLCEADWQSIATVAANKLKLKPKQIRRLLLKDRVNEHAAGTELPHGDCSAYLINDALIFVSTFDALPPANFTDEPSVDIASLPILPVWPAHPSAPAAAEPTEAPAAEALAPETATASVEPSTADAILAPPPIDLTFDGPFPRLASNVLPLVREAISGCDGFTESRIGSYIAFDYRADEASAGALFPPPHEARKNSRERWMRAVRRECRGLLLSAVDGTVLARRFHKFFNVGELPETAPEHVPLDGACRLVLKLDGSLASPLLVPDVTPVSNPSAPPVLPVPLLIWATRKHASAAISDFVARTAPQHSYGPFALRWLHARWTPLFEWCEARRTAGVVVHAADSLTLLAMRHIESGAYMSRPELEAAASEFRIPIVGEVPLDCTASAEALQQAVSRWESVEGAVLVAADGMMFKLKSTWWLALSSASKRASHVPFLVSLLQARPTLAAVPAEAVWAACLASGRDDELPACLAALPPRDAQRLASFARAVDDRVGTVKATLQDWGVAARRQIGGVDGKAAASSVRVALQCIVQEAGWSHGLAVALTSGDDHDHPGARSRALITQLRATGSSQRSVASIEQLLGMAWERWSGDQGGSDGGKRGEDDEEVVLDVTDAATPALTTSSTASSAAKYTAAFLPAATSAAIRAAYPKRHVNAYEDLHCTLMYKPDASHLERLVPMVGMHLTLEVIEEVADDKGHALRIRLPDALAALCTNAHPHVTLSTAHGISAVYSNELLARPPAQQPHATSPLPLATVECVIGVMMYAEATPLPAQVCEQVEAFVRDAPGGAKLRLRPEQLDARGRMQVHQYASAHGVLSESEGKKGSNERRLTLAIPIGVRIAQEETPDGGDDSLAIFSHANVLHKPGPKSGSSERTELWTNRVDELARLLQLAPLLSSTRATTPSALSADAAEPAGECEDGLFYHRSLPAALSSEAARMSVLGPLSEAVRLLDAGGSVPESMPSPTEKAYVVAIMRGLPGSGKSSLTRRLIDAWQCAYANGDAVVCSADSFFDAGAGLSRRRLQELAAAPGAPSSVYRLAFDRTKLGAAHAHCREQFTDGTRSGCGLVVVDNTNTTLEEYAFYRRAARQAGYEVLVLEVLGSRAARGHIDQLFARNTHGVPLAVLHSMYDRWQPDVHSPAVVRLRPLGLSE